MSRNSPIRAVASFAAIAAAAVVLAGCAGGSASPEPEGDQTLRISMNAPPGNWAVGNWSGGDSLLQLSVLDSIFTIAVDGSVVPNIAESWEYSEDRTELTLDIRDGMEFTDGTPVDADAVAASLEASRTGASTAGLLTSIESVAATDDSTVLVTLSEPDGALLGLLGQISGVVGAPDVLTAESSKLEPVGSGAYTLDQEATIVGSKYVLTRNDDNWNADAYPYEKVEVSVIQDPTAVLNALQTGQLDYSGVTSADEVKQFDTAKFSSGNLLPTAFGALWLVDREGTVVPALADVRVRQAINMAFDRETIAASVNPGASQATAQVVSPNHDAYDPAFNDVYAYDVEGAKQLMADAGYADGFAVTMPSTVVSTSSESYVTQALADIGITVTWESVPFQDFYAKVFGGTYGMFYMYNGFGTSSAADLGGSTSTVFNPFNVTTPEFLELESTADAASDADQAEAWRAVNEYLVDDAWVAPIAYVTPFYVASTVVDFTPPAVYGTTLLAWSPAAGN